MSERDHVIEKDGDLQTDKINQAIEKIGDGQKEQILADFGAFQEYLAKRIQMAQGIGLNEEQLAVTAEKIADYLAANEEPRNREEKLLQELWKVGEKDERHKLAHMLVRLAQQ
ncbi:DUF3243 domain-containing protein [Paenibacillus aurantius]|uniref:DUF3243 domain-containing protein n=1 Tax=Paenibacillus aurantius TaxID=2918900 RepID=A0AA96LB09_9BACL|nr:DUF3243 domain-containing protein [Paenibacillus aurantius]WNQ10494.1 DUF3243 domain-containing protein [Paenibacillus aurantius]